MVNRTERDDAELLGIQRDYLDNADRPARLRDETVAALRAALGEPDPVALSRAPVVLRRKDGRSMADYQTLKRLDEFKNFMEAMPEISKVNSITTVLKKINEARHDDPAEYRIPIDNADLRAVCELRRLGTRGPIRRLIDRVKGSKCDLL